MDSEMSPNKWSGPKYSPNIFPSVFPNISQIFPNIFPTTIEILSFYVIKFPKFLETPFFQKVLDLDDSATKMIPWTSKID